MYERIAVRAGAVAALCAGFLLLIASTAFAGTLSISANPATFDNAGDTVTLTYTFDSGNNITKSLTVNSTVGPKPDCSFSQLDTNETWSCSRTYTVTASDYSAGFFVVIADWSATNNSDVPSSGTQTLRVTRASGGSTGTTVTASSSTSSYGEAVTLSATVSPNGGGTPTGTVSFSAAVGGTTTQLGSKSIDAAGNASLTTTELPAGNSYYIYAQYSGDANYSGSLGLVSHTVTPPSNNANLSDLQLNNGALSPAFASGTTSYTASVANSVSSITVTPTTADSTATVKVNGDTVTSGNASGAIQLSVGSNPITVTVTAQDGTTQKSYSVAVNRAASSNAALSSLIVAGPSPIALTPSFSPGTTNYSADVPYDVSSVTVTPTTADSTATVKVNGGAVTSGNASGGISLSVGANSIGIVVTAQDGTTQTTYQVKVTRNGPPPTVDSRTINMIAGASATVPLADGAQHGPFTSASIVNNSNPASGTVSLQSTPPYDLTFKADPAFSGNEVVTFTLTNQYGTSTPGTITFAVAARPDPSKDPEVVGLLNAQVDSARRFARSQIGNFNHRLEQLHDEGPVRKNHLSLGLQGGAMPPADETDPFAGLLGHQRGAAQPGSPSTATAYGPTDRPIESAPPKRRPGMGNLAFWSDGYVNFGNSDASGQDFTTVGVSAGVDYRFSPRLIAGFGIGYGHDASDIGTNGTTSRAHAYSAAGYASYRLGGHMFLDGLLGGGSLDFDSHRFDTTTGAYADGERSGRQIFGSLTASYETHRSGWLVSPYGRVSFSRSWLDGFTESGAGLLSLRYGTQTVDTLSGAAGLRVRYSIPFDWGVLRPGARIEYTHDFAGNSQVRLGYADLKGLPYGLSVTGSDDDYLTFGASLDAAMRNGWTVGVAYRGSVSSDVMQNGINLSIGKRF